MPHFPFLIPAWATVQNDNTLGTGKSTKIDGDFIVS
jgi:hypothetical protein